MYEVLMKSTCVFRTYSRARRVLEQYQDMPSFKGIQQDCKSIISQLIVTLKEKMDDPRSTTSTLAETVDLLLELNEPSRELFEQFLVKYMCLLSFCLSVCLSLFFTV